MCLTFWTLSGGCRTLSSMKSGHSGGRYKVWKGVRFLSSHLRLHMHYIILTTAKLSKIIKSIKVGFWSYNCSVKWGHELCIPHSVFLDNILKVGAK